MLSLAGCAARETPAPGPAYAPGQLALPGGAPASEGDFLQLAASAQYILIGERHDSALDHKVQASLLRSLAADGARPLLGLEMLPRKRLDSVLASFVRGETDIDALPGLLDWQTNWGFDFDLYRDVFVAARQSGIPAYGANIPNDLRRKVSRKGLDGLTPAEKRQLPHIVPPMPEQRQKLAEFFSRHSAMLASARSRAIVREKEERGGGAQAPLVERTVSRPAALAAGAPAGEAKQAAFERFLLIQSLWDSAMAETAVGLRRQAGGTRPVVILAGGGHVEHGYGIASRLKLFDPEARSLLVMPFSGARPEPGAAHIYFFSPAPREGAMAAAAAQAKGQGRLGITLQPGEDGKLRVLSVTPDSRAARAGVLSGDVIERAGSVVVASAADLHKAALEAKARSRPLALALRRQGEIVALYVPEAE